MASPSTAPLAPAPAAPAHAAAVFGPALPVLERYAALLAGPGVERGLLGLLAVVIVAAIFAHGYLRHLRHSTDGSVAVFALLGITTMSATLTVGIFDAVLLRPETALVVAERLRLAIASRPWPLGSVTASFGVACYQPGDSLEALLARADAAIYRAKRGGRNRGGYSRPVRRARG